MTWVGQSKSLTSLQGKKISESPNNCKTWFYETAFRTVSIFLNQNRDQGKAEREGFIEWR